MDNGLADDLEAIRQRRGSFAVQSVEMETKWNDLRHDFLSRFGHSSFPLVLAKVRNNAYAPIIWRDAVQSREKRGATRLDSERGRQVLAGLDPGQRAALWEMERRRIKLSHNLGMLWYREGRLRRLQADLEGWGRQG